MTDDYKNLTFFEALEVERKTLRAKNEYSVVPQYYWQPLLEKVSFSTASLEDLVESIFLFFKNSLLNSRSVAVVVAA